MWIYVDICGYMRYIQCGLWHLLDFAGEYVDLWYFLGEYVDYHLAAEPAPAPSTTAPPPQLSSPHHPGAPSFSCHPGSHSPVLFFVCVQQLSSEKLIVIGE